MNIAGTEEHTYNGKNITSVSSFNDEGEISSSNIVPLRLFMSYERKLSNKLLLCTELGVYYGARTRKWYYSDDIEDYKSLREEPEPVQEEVSISHPGINGFEPYIGIGLRF